MLRERSPQSGATLIETVVVLAIVAVFALAAAGLVTHRIGTAKPTHGALVAAFAAARAVADADGATLALGPPDAAGTARFTVCPGRPRSIATSFGTGCTTAAVTSSTIALDGIGPPPWAMFLDPSGSASAAAWQIGSLLAVEPTCAASVGIVVDGVRTGALDCIAGRIVDASPG
jgi:prepilin-type N-terminal cleavage/methylation domain-containing protein